MTCRGLKSRSQEATSVTLNYSSRSCSESGTASLRSRRWRHRAGEVYGRMVRLSVFGGEGAAQLDDLEDQFRRLAALAGGQREYLHGVIDFYQTRTGTKMTIAAERLAVIAAVTLPVTALSSIYGMNVIVYGHTVVGQLMLVLAVMLIMSGILLVWTRRKGWW